MIIDLNKRPDTGTTKHSNGTETAKPSAPIPAPARAAEEAVYFACNGHDSAYRSLLDGIQRHEGCIVLSGESGVGKTLLFRKLVKEVSSPACRLVYCPSSAIEFDQLISFIGDKLELPMPSTDHQAQVAVFRDYLKVCAESNIAFALLLDDAHLLRDELAERLFALPELNQCPVSIVLSAWPDFLNRLTGWRQRFPLVTNAFLVSLPRLSDSEAQMFIQHNLRTASVPLELTVDIIRRMADQVARTPRDINAFCDQILALARHENTVQITDALIQQAIAQLTKSNESKSYGGSATPLPTPRASPLPRRQLRAAAKVNASMSANHSGLASRRAKPIVATLLSASVLFISGWGFVKYGGDSSDMAPSVAPGIVAPLKTSSTVADSEGPVVKSTASGHLFDLGYIANSARKPQVLEVLQAPADISPTVTPNPVLAEALAANVQSPSDSGEEAIESDPELHLWGRIRDSKDIIDYQTYLDAYPQGRFAKLAELRQQRLSLQREDELNAFLIKSKNAFERKALTTPSGDNAAKWAEAALQIDPGNREAQAILYSVLDQYIVWASQNLDRRRLSSVNNYLQRAQGLESYAKPEQIAALDVLSKQLVSEQRRLAKQQAKRSRSRTTTARASNTRPNRRTSASVPAVSWLQHLDQTMQSIGQEIDRKMGTHGRTTVRQGDLSGFQNR